MVKFLDNQENHYLFSVTSSIILFYGPKFMAHKICLWNRCFATPTMVAPTLLIRAIPFWLWLDWAELSWILLTNKEIFNWQWIQKMRQCELCSVFLQTFKCNYAWHLKKMSSTWILIDGIFDILDNTGCTCGYDQSRGDWDDKLEKEFQWPLSINP